MPTPSPLARYIARLLDATGESPEQFAVRVGINSSGFHKFLSGRYQELKATNLNKVATGLGSSPVDLLCAIGTGPTPIDHDEAELLAVFRQVPATYRVAAKLMLRGLVPPVRDRAEQPIRRPKPRLTAVPLKRGGKLTVGQYAHVILVDRAA